MDSIIAKIIVYMPMLMQILGALVIVATVAARFTPSPSDDSKVKKVADMFFKFLSYLPTLGINPNTAKIKAAYDDLVKEK